MHEYYNKQAFDAMFAAHPARGMKDVNIAITDADTGQTMVSYDGGETYERAHALIESMVTGKPYIDPGKVDPRDADAELTIHVCKYLVEHYRRDLLEHKLLEEAVSGILASARNDRRGWMARQSDNYGRWDLLLESLFEWLDAH
ncbi:hypothetical protein VQ02_07330 [Methylobacterium variabile]|uniref:Uncharacterized protein n=1 Tax=Methylobacterium variabile TaxID=298794 RepID=A0A0J6T3Y6_9HYPH|nr:hypothetical protein [Methylobacterium variabile]KMO40644.1 hypothetical protein VQ02_07330 [Methylobacterium variabile]